MCERPTVLRRPAVPNYSLCACPSCKLEFLDPQPEDALLAAIYGNQYFLGDSPDRAQRRSQMKAATGALYLDVIAGFFPPENSKLLEIGCGHGEVLMEARKRGFHVSGVEISGDAAAIANERLGASTVLVGSVETLQLPRGRFHAVLAADVIEHVRRPEGCLMIIRDLLAAGGVLLLVTPSLDSWPRRALGSHWLEYKVEHLHYFSAASIRLLLERAGFDEIRIIPARKVLTFDYIGQHFDRFRVPILTPVVALARRALPRYIAHRHILITAGGLMATACKRK